jgi:hypothetical protein
MFSNTFHAEMRVRVEYVALALSSGLGYSARASTVELEVAPGPFRVRASGPNCWAASDGVSASFGSFGDL